jgi:hypothetical protein
MTYLSKAIGNSTPDAGYWMEPKEVVSFCNLERRNLTSGLVVKIIFEHWNYRPVLANAIL